MSLPPYSRGKSLLITGIGGFIGSHFVDYFLRNTEYSITGIDSFRHKGTYSRLTDLNLIPSDQERLTIFHHDLSIPIDLQLARKIGDHYDHIINLASNSAVERSIGDPSECWRNNCDLILNMLEFARRCNDSGHLRSFIQISTDEVYGDAMLQTTGHKEWDRIIPSNPYSASKAAQEALAISYWRTYELPLVIVNCMNCIGERQDVEKFLPRIINAVYHGKEVPIYCNQNNMPGSRVYLDCQNHARAIDFIMRRAAVHRYDHGDGDPFPSRFNVCGERELTNLEFADYVAYVIGKELKYKLVQAESARPGYDRRYFLDGGLLKQLGWQPHYTFEDTINRIVQHAMKKPEWI